MIPLHSLLTMTPASSPADEKPSLDSFDEVQQQGQQQNFANQGPTPPQDPSQNEGPSFYDPFAPNPRGALSRQPSQFPQHGGVPVPQHHQTPSQPQSGPTYTFNRGYQNGPSGSFGGLQQRTDSVESSNGSAPGTPGTNRVAIPRRGTGSVGESSGPMSKEIKLPPRAKPGRKPIENSEESAQDRRRTQNRIAQRNFRDRRTQKTAEMASDLEQQRNTLQQQMAQSNNTIAQLRERNNAQAREIGLLQAEVEKLREQIRVMQQYERAQQQRRDTAAEGAGAGAGNRSRMGPFPSTPPTSSHAHTHTNSLETDFTNYGRPTGAFRPGTSSSTPSNTIQQTLSNSNNQQHTAQPTAARPSSSGMTAIQTTNSGTGATTAENPAAALMLGIEGKEYNCGFCTDASNCQCRVNDTMTANALLMMKKDEMAEEGEGVEDEDGDEEMGEGDEEPEGKGQ